MRYNAEYENQYVCAQFFHDGSQQSDFALYGKPYSYYCGKTRNLIKPRIPVLTGDCMDLAEAFGVVVRELRIEAGLTQEQLGFEAGIRRTFVSVLELGQQQPTLTTIFKIAPALALTPSALIELVEKRIKEVV